MRKGFFVDRKYPPIGFGRDPEETDAKFDDYLAVGKVLVSWAQDRSKWPTNLKDFRDWLGAKHADYTPRNTHLVIPEEIKQISIVQAGDGDGPFPNVQKPRPDVKPEKVEKYEQITDDAETGPQFILRLPPCEQVTESEDRAEFDNDDNKSYLLPPLYTVQLFKQGSQQNMRRDGTPISQLEMFYARVADYTMRSCR